MWHFDGPPFPLECHILFEWLLKILFILVKFLSKWGNYLTNLLFFLLIDAPRLNGGLLKKNGIFPFFRSFLTIHREVESVSSQKRVTSLQASWLVKYVIFGSSHLRIRLQHHCTFGRAFLASKMLLKLLRYWECQALWPTYLGMLVSGPRQFLQMIQQPPPPKKKKNCLTRWKCHNP